MIKYKSTLLEDDTKNINEFVSDDELNNIDNVVVIEGPNDFGKSILLHCIAVSAYGLDFFKEDPKKINEELKKKLDWLLDPEDKFSKLEYNLDITYDRGGSEIKFTSNKSLDKREIDRKLNDNYTTFNNFKKDFNLIYDIPSNPTKRLEELLVESEVKLNDIHNIVDNFNNYLSEIDESLNTDPEEQLKVLNEELRCLKESRETSRIQYGGLNQKLNSLKNYQVIRDYDSIINNLKGNEPKLKQIKSKLDSLKRSKETTSRSKSIIRDFYGNAEDYDDELLTLLDDLSIDGDKKIKDQIGELNDLDKPNDIKNNEGKKYLNIVHEIKMYCNELKRDVVDQTVNENIKFLQALKDAIKDRPEIIDTDDIGPDIQNFLSTIDKYLKKHADSEFQANFDNIFTSIEKIENNISNGVAAYSNLSEDDNLSDEDSNYEALRAQYDHLNAKIKDLKAKEKTSRVNIDKLKEVQDLDSFKTAIRGNYPDAAKLSNDEFVDNLKSLESKTRNERQNFNGLNMTVEGKEKIIEKLKTEKRPQYSSERESIETLLNELNSIIFNTGNQFKAYFKSITSSKSAVENDTEEKFRKSLFRYISTKTPTINHAGNDYEVELIDPIKKTIATKDGRTIPFQSFGTGKSQSASLLNRINSLDPSKKNIVLFDEIAHMDDESLKPIKTRLKELYEEGTLFVGILVQKGSKVKIESLLT